MRTFCRLFLSIEEEGEQLRLEIRVNPDREQVPSGEAIAVISCSSFDGLGVCLEDLGVTGRSQFGRESESGPITEHVPSTPAALLEHVRTNRPSTLTLIAADTSAQDMNRRIVLLKEKRELGIRVRQGATAL
jgi:hypothetical protein